MHQEALGGRLVPAELPDAPEGRQEGRKPSLRANWEAMRPALLGDLRCIALGDRPGARRVHDQRALPGDQHLVVAGIVPGRDVDRQELHEFFVVLESLANLIILDDDFTLGIDQDRAERMEECAYRIDAVGRRTEPYAERVSTLLAGFGSLQKGIDRPRLRLGRRPHRVHRLDIDPGILLQVVDP